MIWADGAGLVGVIITIIAYAGASLGKLSAVSPLAHSMNLVGGSLILLSLAFHFNLSAVMMEGSWVLIASIGLVRSLMAKRAR